MHAHMVVSKCVIKKIGNFSAVEAVVIDKDHNRKHKLMEWVGSNHHVNRADSIIMDNYTEIGRYIAFDDLFDLLDQALDRLFRDDVEFY